MKSLTGGALLLVLGVPLALYAALAVKAVARADLVGGDPPADRGASKDDLAKLRARAGNWLGEVRKATTVAGQYRAAAPEDGSSDRTADAAIRAASARADDLLDVDAFLSNTANPKFKGRLAPVLGAWHAGRSKLADDERDIARWFDAPPPIRSAGDAKDAMGKALDLIAQYTGRTQFADRAKAAEWRVRARLHIVTALEKVAGEQYELTVRRRLPLEASATEATKAALVALGEQTRALGADAEQARTDGATLAPAVVAQANALKPLSDESAARKTLLDLFAEEQLFGKPGGAAAWLKRVGDEYRRTKDARARELIRDKVQEFCEAFVAPAARLDDAVLFKGKQVPRGQIEVKYRPKPGAAAEFEPLSADPTGLNEFTAAKRFSEKGTYFLYKGNDEFVTDFTPTELSVAAVEYNRARAKVADAPGRAKWTPNSLAELKKACEEKKELVDQLKVPGGAVPQLWVRLAGLADGSRTNPDLFGDQ